MLSARRETVVDRDDALVRDHVARNPAADADGVESLPVDEPVDLDLLRFVRRERRQDGRGSVDRVSSHPRARRVGAHPGGADVDTHGSVAAALDESAGGFAEDGEVAGEQVRPVAGQSPEAVEVGSDLLVVVPDPGHVDDRVGELRGKLQLHRDPALHVDGAPAPEHVALQPSRQIVVHRHGVDVAGNDHPALATQPCAGDHRVAVPDDLEMREAAERLLDRIRQRSLVAGHRLDVAHRPGDLGGGCGQVKAGHAASLMVGSLEVWPNEMRGDTGLRQSLATGRCSTPGFPSLLWAPSRPTATRIWRPPSWRR